MAVWSDCISEGDSLFKVSGMIMGCLKKKQAADGGMGGCDHVRSRANLMSEILSDGGNRPYMCICSSRTPLTGFY